ncbi:MULTISPECIES: DUF1206 domain-containing protein [unclassified Streptomyces]|uniref:DUF1206 domain-containing protein n=1 Tax=unclassified Streptomyces TaxID=2593676 RepID=UPI002DD934FC|nr:DUF1206 domain-containing protein [Streptomyces sp. NBC_01237]WRZ70765.1 DUF1206 domain-containing protein [Streptomyces sp. NBC_01237]
MTSAHAHGRRGGAKRGGRRSAQRSAPRETFTAAGRAGFMARGVVYVLIGVLAARIGLGDRGEQADRQGALGQVAAQPFGNVMLWTLVVGFAGMALWRGSRAVRGKGGGAKQAGSRLLDAGRAVFYVSVGWGTAVYAAGQGQGADGDAQSRDWTAKALELPYGQVMVGAAGCVLIGVGVVLAGRAGLRRFLRRLDTGAMSRRTKRAVTVLGVGGGVARGAVFAAAGLFVVVAAVRFQPDEAKGVDETLRSFATTPAGPWLLIAVAFGLVLFGVFSFASARWRRL